MYYKNVRVLPDGRRVSQFVDDGDLDCKMLEYKPCKVTKAPRNSHGVYCYSNLDIAKHYVNGNTNIKFTGVVEVRIAYPIGKGRTTVFGTAFPAIRLGRTIARYKVVSGFSNYIRRIYRV